MKRRPLWWLLFAISAITLISGLVQMVDPVFVLRIVQSEATPTSCHFFGIVGMFMLLFGGALLHELTSSIRQPVVALWAGLQKFGASAAVGLGVAKGIFAPGALGVAGFDLLSSFLIGAYWLSIRKSP